jgi:hypothetical protein
MFKKVYEYIKISRKNEVEDPKVPFYALCIDSIRVSEGCGQREYECLFQHRPIDLLGVVALSMNEYYLFFSPMN